MRLKNTLATITVIHKPDVHLIQEMFLSVSQVSLKPGDYELFTAEAKSRYIMSKH